MRSSCTRNRTTQYLRNPKKVGIGVGNSSSLNWARTGANCIWSNPHYPPHACSLYACSLHGCRRSRRTTTDAYTAANTAIELIVVRPKNIFCLVRWAARWWCVPAEFVIMPEAIVAITHRFFDISKHTKTIGSRRLRTRRTCRERYRGFVHGI